VNALGEDFTAKYDPAYASHGNLWRISASMALEVHFGRGQKTWGEDIMGIRHIDYDKCIRCGRCVTYCPQDVFGQMKKTVRSSPTSRIASPAFCAKNTARPEP